MSTPALASPPRLRRATLDDYDAIARLESAHAFEMMSRDDWRSLWLNNPLWPRLGRDWPIGWVLENQQGQVVGSLANIPSRYEFQGRDFVCANGRGWVVASQYRGFSLALMDEYFSQPGVDLFVNSTVGPNAVALIETLSTRIPLGDFQTTAFWVTGYRALAKRLWQKLHVPLAGWLAYPTAAALRLKDSLLRPPLATAPNGVAVECVDRFDDRFDAFWHELRSQNHGQLIGVRDAQTLAWHYSSPLRLGRLWVITAVSGGRLLAYCVVKQQDRAGALRRMRLIEYQTLDPQADLLSPLLREALDRCTAEGYDLLEHLGCNLPKLHVVDRFAPYRRKLPSWAYYYRAVDPDLARELQRPAAWDPSMFDGDASFD